jgi:hypothetical protein
MKEAQMALAKTPKMARLTDGTIRVSVPAGVMYNFEKSQLVMRNVLGLLGCPNCHSGNPILLQGIEQEFIADAAGKVRAG